MTLLVLAVLVLSPAVSARAADPDPDFNGQLSQAIQQTQAETRALKSERHQYLGLGKLPKMVFLVHDKATDDWAHSAPSKYDGQPILGPKTPNKRWREEWVDLQGALNGMGKPPLAVAWDYYFNKSPQPETPATDELARLFDSTSFPLILSGWTENGSLDPRIHHDGPLRYEGHISVWEENGDKHYFSPVSSIDPRVRNVPDEDSIVEVTVGAILSVKRHVSKEEGLRQARELAQQVAGVMPAEEKGVYQPKDDKGEKTGQAVDYDVKGIRLIERPIPTVPIVKVIQGDRESLKKIEGAIVFVGNSVTDNADILAENEQRSKGYVHAWTIMQLLGSHMQ